MKIPRKSIIQILGVFSVAYLLTGSATPALALPQFSVESSRQCDNCHLDPKNWPNPELKDRKCTLSCNGCHVNPSGGGLRNTAGGFYGREILPMFGDRPSDRPRVTPPSSQPSSQPQSRSTPTAGWVSKVSLAELPALSLLGSKTTYFDAGAGTPSRYAGMDPFPRFQVGTDVRFMVYRDQSQKKTSFFPMQLDLHLAATPIKVSQYNEGRLTLLTTIGVEGSRTEAYDNMFSRFFAKEYFALYDNLPYNLYAKAGRFLPAFGWRLDDHTSLVRQNFTFDNEGQKTGIEFGLNPNYAYAHASFFNSSSNWEKPFDTQSGYGTALHMGYRELLWQAGTSFMYEKTDVSAGTWAGFNWSLNFHDATENHPWKGLDWIPLIYLGELDYRRTSPEDGGRTINALAAFHELNWLIIRGLNFKTRYDWRDMDLKLLDDHQHRYTFGFDYHPYTFVELTAQVRVNVPASGDRYTEGLFIIHGWY